MNNSTKNNRKRTMSVDNKSKTKKVTKKETKTAKTKKETKNVTIFDILRKHSLEEDYSEKIDLNYQEIFNSHIFYEMSVLLENSVKARWLQINHPEIYKKYKVAELLGKERTETLTDLSKRLENFGKNYMINNGYEEDDE